MLARVMTINSNSENLADLIGSLRQRLPETYVGIQGFRGALVLEKPSANQILALTLWEDERGLKASEPHARKYAQEISQAIAA
ncbi:MAG TPA: hypothetical protein VKR22_14725, partial [Acidimicrobiales bacterium]|nr:hypothetical protein [Acidimicrobiales bacterium]